MALPLEDLGLAPGGGDAVLGPRAELVGTHRQGPREVALRQDLDTVADPLVPAALQEQVGRDDRARLEDLQARQVDLRELATAAVVEPGFGGGRGRGLWAPPE